MALTTVLVVTAGLLLRSYQSLGQSDLGFRTEGILRMAVFVDQRDVAHDDQLGAFRERLRATLLTYPGVEEVGLVWPTVPPGTGGDTRIMFDRMPEASSEHGLPVSLHAVDAHFLAVMDIPLAAGRGIEAGDDAASAQVAVISEALGTLMGGTDRALGQSIEVGGDVHRIVGVTRDVMFFGPIRRRPRDFDVYVPIAQVPTRLVSIAVATNGDPGDYLRPLSDRLAALAPSSAQDWVGPMTGAIGGHFEGRRFYLLLLGAFAFSALALTAVGLFAVMANLVARQSSEFGIRLALGADRMRIVGTVMRRGLLLAVAGLALGGAGAVLVGRLMQGFLHGVGSFDPVTFAATAVIIAGVAAVASYVPALNAARANPSDAMRAA
jgi:hypothetical protein